MRYVPTAWGRFAAPGCRFLFVDGAKVVLHSIPVRRDLYAINIDVGSVDRQALVPLGCGSPQPLSYDFDGAFAVQPGPGDTARSYAALFRNGMIEAVDTNLLRAAAAHRFLPGAPVVGAIIVATRRYLVLQQSLGIAAPLAVGVSLLGVKGYWLAADDSVRNMTAHEVLHEELIFPEVVIRDLSEDPMALLRDTFDQLWNAVGMPSCKDYDDTRRLAQASNRDSRIRMRTDGARWKPCIETYRSSRTWRKRDLVAL